MEGASARLTRALLAEARETAVLLPGEGSTAALVDCVLRDVLGRQRDGDGSSAVAVQRGATATVARTVIARARGSGALVFSGASLSLTDVRVDDTRGKAGDGTKGTGQHVQGGGAIDGERVAIRRAREVGLLAIEEGSRATLADVRVEDTLQRDCAATTCPDVGFGDGVVAALGASISLVRFVIARNARVGVLSAGEVRLRRGRIAGHPIGANVRPGGTDPAAWTEDVRFEDNERDVDAALLPIPDAAQPPPPR
jgi:hypothetical protein